MTKIAAIIGGGVIGGGWAARFLLNGWSVRVFDPDPQAERKIGEVLANARRSLPGLADVAMPTEGALTFHASIAEAVAGASAVQAIKLTVKPSNINRLNNIEKYFVNDFIGFLP